MKRQGTVDRDSVCAGDDVDAHDASLLVDTSDSILSLLREAQRASPPASIAGGRATWLIDTQGSGRGCIGVIVQQWSQPQLLIPERTTMAEVFGDGDIIVYLRYWCQADPDAVFEALKAGTALPAR